MLIYLLYCLRIHVVLIMLFCLFLFLPSSSTLASTCNKAITKQVITQNDSVQIAYYKGASYHVKVIGSHKKKLVVQFLDSEKNKEQCKVAKKNVFNTLLPDNEIIPKKMRFVFYDNVMADEVIIKGNVIGFNTNHYLIEFENNGRIQQTVKHKSEIVQKDLNNK